MAGGGDHAGRRLALALVWLIVGAGIARAETRVALVIGNGSYREVATLANPPNDARDVAAELRTLGFKVTLGVDLDQASMDRAIAEFTLAAASADVSLFYYGVKGGVFTLTTGGNFHVEGPDSSTIGDNNDLAMRAVLRIAITRPLDSRRCGSARCPDTASSR